MQVVFRVDASLLIGSGHVMRCLVLADALQQQGYQIIFACTELEGDMRGYIAERGFKLLTLAAPKTYLQPRHEADYAAWLQKTPEQDAYDFVAAVKSADLVITDHYNIAACWQRIVVARLGCYLMAIDDLARCHQADLILDQTLGRDASDYASSKSWILAGSQYALLRTQFASQREAAFTKTFSGQPLKIMLSMGGIDLPNATLTVLSSLYNRVNAAFTVLLSPRAPHYQKVKTWCASHPQIVHKDFIDDMASLMLQHDIAIGASGSTSWERACLGLPSIVIPIAENQQFTAKQLAAQQAALVVQLNDIDRKLSDAVIHISQHWSQFQHANLVTCDGRGAYRVVWAIKQLMAKGERQLMLEQATSQDIELVYQWQIHPNTRQYALTPRIPTWQEHCDWMNKKLQSYTDYFYLLVDKLAKTKLGVVRLDRIKMAQYSVSIFVNPEYYHQGVARQALAAIDVIHPDLTLHATVLKENIASQRLFKKANYQKITQEHYMRAPMC